MEYFGLNNTKQLFERLKQSLSNYSNEGFSVKIYDNTSRNFDNSGDQDITIYKWNHPVAIFEVKDNLLANPSKHIMFSIPFGHESLISRFKVICSNNQFFLYDTYLKNKDFEEVTYDEVINQIVHPIPIEFSEKEKKRNTKYISSIPKGAFKR